MASATEVETEREMSIPVQAVVCKATQCAPLRYSAQHRIKSLCRKDLTKGNSLIATPTHLKLNVPASGFTDYRVVYFGSGPHGNQRHEQYLPRETDDGRSAVELYRFLKTIALTRAANTTSNARAPPSKD